MKLIVSAVLGLIMLIPAGASKNTEMVSDAKIIFQLLEDMVVCQEAGLPIVKMLSCLAKVHIKPAKSPVDKRTKSAGDLRAGRLAGITYRKIKVNVKSEWHPFHRSSCSLFAARTWWLPNNVC